MSKTLLLFVVSFCTAAINTASLTAQEYYVSNYVGMTLQKIPATHVDSHEYVLKISRTVVGEIKELLKSGSAIKQWRRELDNGVLVKEVFYERGKAVSEHNYENGKVKEEYVYKNGRIAEKKIFHYERDILTVVQVFDADGDLIYEDTYAIDANGRLRSIRRAGAEAVSESIYRYSDEQMVEEWHGKSDAGVLYRYSDWDLSAIEHWTGVEQTKFDEITIENGKEKRVSVDEKTGFIVTRLYDVTGRIIEEYAELSGHRIETVTYRYAEEKLLSRARLTEGLREIWTYEYGDDDSLLSETLRRNNLTVKVTTYTGPDAYMVVIYNRKEIPVLRIYFENDLKVREEIISSDEDGTE